MTFYYLNSFIIPASDVALIYPLFFKNNSASRFFSLRRKILKQSGVKARPLYNLRHTFASQMISKGADITWVSKMLGHKDVSITLKIYTKFIQEDDETRLKKIAQMDKFMVKFDNSDEKNTDK